jgi:hypothetical protein
MTALVANYVFSPLSGLWSSLDRFTQVIGYSRAAAELARMGMIEESKRCMMEIGRLQNDR